VLTLAHSLHAQAKNDQHVQESLRVFVQSFYDWYAPKALGSNSGPAWNNALRTKEGYFSPGLALKLRNDADAQAKAEGEIVGLDFDPFLNGQDPGEHYEVGKIVQRGESYWVDIHSVSSGKMSEKPTVIAEVVQRNDQWRFVNFHYLNGRDLLGVLKALKENREQPPSKGALSRMVWLTSSGLAIREGQRHALPRMETLFTQALGLSTPWRVVSVDFKPSEDLIVFEIASTAKRATCLACGVWRDGATEA
jgi:hypothetical protein